MSDKLIAGVSQYPLAQWQSAGAPVMTAEPWAMFTLPLANSRPEFAHFIGIAERLEASPDALRHHGLKYSHGARCCFREGSKRARTYDQLISPQRA